jgi:hypothetical protein
VLANATRSSGLEQHYGCSGRLVQRERLAEAPSALTSAVKLHEVGVQEVEDSTVARAEIAATALEDELLGLPARADAEPDAERVLDTQWLHCEVVHPSAVQLAPGEEVRELRRVGAPLPEVEEYGTLRIHDGLDRRPVEAAGEALVTGTIEVGTVPVATASVAVAVGNPVGRHEPSELREELPGEGWPPPKLFASATKRSSRPSSPGASAGMALGE